MAYSALGHLRFLVRDVGDVTHQRWTDAQLQEFLDEASREFFWRSGKTVSASVDASISSGADEQGPAFAANAGLVVAVESVDFKTGAGDYVPVPMDSWLAVKWMHYTEGITSTLYPAPYTCGVRFTTNLYTAAGPQQSLPLVAFYPGGNYTFRMRCVLLGSMAPATPGNPIDLNQIGLSQVVPYAAAIIAATVGWDKKDVAYLLREAPEWAQIAQQTNRWSTRPNTYQLQDAMAGVS